MLEILIEKVEYIAGVPIELTKQAIEAGAIRKGEIVGLLVSTIDNPSKKFRIELRVREKGQEKLIKAGKRIPVTELIDGRYVLYNDWEYYL